MQIGKQLAELRKKYHYKQTELAEKLNVSQQVVSNIERGLSAPDIEFLKGVADLYHISLDQVVGREYFDEETAEDVEMNVTIKHEKDTQTAEMYLYTRGTSYKAVTESKDLYASIDKDIDILEGQMRKTKAKKEKMQRDSSLKQMTILGEEEKSIENEIVKNAYYDVRPISIEDAKIKLSEKVGTLFYTFINVDTGKVNVIFKLKDSKNFGLIEPDR